jgi:superfamily I DNA/RNA helicase
VIEGQNCGRLDDYLAANRSGRGIPFDDTVRTGVWRLYQEYCSRLKEKKLGSWGQLRQFALELVRRDAFVRRWDHVIIDEAQDLTPAALAVCVELAREPRGVFLTADANQSLYNRSFRWNKVHEMLAVAGRTHLLRRNYRNTRQIAQAASDLLPAIKLGDAEAIEQEYVHAGTKPVIYAAGGAADQAQWLAARIAQACRELGLSVSAAAVLAPGNSLAKSLSDRLQAAGLPARYVKSRDVHLDERCVKVMTLPAAKGLEFPIVGIAHVEADRLPREASATDPKEIAEHVDQERRVFYVGCTRAMRHLFVTHDRSSPSPFLDELSEEYWVREGGEEKTEANSS